MNKGNDTFRNVNTIAMAKCPMLSNDKLTVEVSALMVGEHRNAEGVKFPKHSLSIENGLSWGMITVVANNVDIVMYWMMVVGRSNVRNERLWMESR